MIQTSPFPPGSLVAAYLRDSGGDDQDLSTDQQEKIIRTWCSERGLILNKLFIDVARSARNTNKRVQFLNMIDHFLHQGAEEKGIILWSFSRFARNLNDASMYKGMLRRAGYEIWSLNDDIPEGPAGRVVEMIKDWMSEVRNIESSIDIKRGQSFILEKYGALGGNPPIGFKREEINIGTKRNGRPHIVSKWVPDPDRWDAVRQAWIMRSAKYSYKDINARLHLFGSVNSFTTMFKNRIYIGELRVGEITISGYVPAMVEPSIWDAVQSINKAKANMGFLKDSKDHPRRADTSYLLSGLLYCGLCHAPMNGRRLTFTKREGSWEYYRCSNANRTHVCSAKQVPMITVDNAVISSVVEYIYKPDFIQNLARIDLDRYDTNTITWRKEREQLTNIMAGVRLKMSNLVSAIAESGHSPILLKSLQDLEAENATLTAQISELSEKISSPPSIPSTEKVNKLILNSMAIIDSGDKKAINRMLRGYVKNIFVSWSGKEIKIKIDYFTPPSNDDPGGTLPPPDSPHNDRQHFTPKPVGNLSLSPAGAYTLNTYHSLAFTISHQRKPYKKNRKKHSIYPGGNSP